MNQRDLEEEDYDEREAESREPVKEWIDRRIL